MGDQSMRVVDDQPHRHGRGRNIPQPGDGEDVEGHRSPPPTEPTEERPQRLSDVRLRVLPDSDEDDVEGHVLLGPKNAAK